MTLRWFPTNRFLVIKQCYDAGVRPSLDDPIKAFGCKFVFHCHFLVHEDTGLMRNVISSLVSATIGIVALALLYASVTCHVGSERDSILRAVHDSF
jgi:hypothetical protein